MKRNIILPLSAAILSMSSPSIAAINTADMQYGFADAASTQISTTQISAVTTGQIVPAQTDQVAIIATHCGDPWYYMSGIQFITCLFL